MLKRLLWLTLLICALLLMLGLMTAQAEAPYAPMTALTPQWAALPPEAPAPLAAQARKPADAQLASLMASIIHPAAMPEDPPARAAYHLRCFSAFHYPDRAG